MKEAEEAADLVLVLGTSLSGLSADKLATAAARRSLGGKSLGTVIVNLQQTPCDGAATLRLFAECDKVTRDTCASCVTRAYPGADRPAGPAPPPPARPRPLPRPRPRAALCGAVRWRGAAVRHGEDVAGPQQGTEDPPPPGPQLPGAASRVATCIDRADI